MSVADRRRDVESNMNKLSLSTSGGISGSASTSLSSSSKTTKTVKTGEPADSWEDEADDEPATPTALHSTVPPPTPASPSGNFNQGHFDDPYALSSAFSSNRGATAGAASGRRPEKSAATAQRMIAGALGVRAPKKTEETKTYEKAIRDNEKKRIDTERDERRRKEEEERKAKESVWED